MVYPGYNQSQQPEQPEEAPQQEILSPRTLLDQMFDASLAYLLGREDLEADFRQEVPVEELTPAVQRYVRRAFDAGARTRRLARPFVYQNGQVRLERYLADIRQRASRIDHREFEGVDDLDQLRVLVENEPIAMIEDCSEIDINGAVALTAAFFAEGVKCLRNRRQRQPRTHAHTDRFKDS